MSVSDPRIGLDFGDYRVTRKLADGGMGAVYLAEHASGMRKVVKFMLGDAAKVPAFRKRFEDECLACKRFKGRSGIVAIDSFGERNGELYLVMEFLDGPTLDQHIRKNVRLTEHHTFHVSCLILRALSTLHEQGITHRDLKPENVFLLETDERPWDPKLIDFGIIHDNKQPIMGEFRTRDGQIVGTPGFMAAEQFGRASTVTAATDVFAVAVIMWLMLTGEMPWGVAENEYAQYDRQLNQPALWPAHVQLAYAPGWPSLFQRALSPDPAIRPQSAQAFALALAQELAPIPPHVPSGIEMVTKLAPRFLVGAPLEVATVRQPEGRLDMAPFWPPRATPGPVSPSGINFDAIRVSAVMAAVPPTASSPTVSARPAGGGVATPAAQTTLSGAAAIATSSPRSTTRSRTIMLGIGTALVVSVVTIGVARFASRRTQEPGSTTEAPASTRSAVAPTQPTDSGSSVASDKASGPSVGVVSPAPAAAKPSADAAKVADSPSGAAVVTKPATPTNTDAQTSLHHGRSRSTAKPLSSTPKVTVDGTPRKVVSPTPPTAGSDARHAGASFDPDAIKE